MPPRPSPVIPFPPPVARVRGLADLAAVVPYLLGFVPRESVTCVGVTAPGPAGRGRRVGLTARVDLADVLEPLAAPLLLGSVFGGIARTGAAGVIALVSSDADAVDPVVVEQLGAAAERAGLELLDVGWHRGAVCHSLMCDDPACCAPEGEPVDPASAAAAAATFAGVTVLPDREAVEAEFAGGDPSPGLDALIADHETAAVRAIVEGDADDRTHADAQAVLDLARAFDDRATGTAPRLTDDDVAACVAALAHTGVRDAVWTALDAGEVHGQGLWLELSRRAPAPYDASPMFLLGWRCWRQGDGLRATLAAARADATPGGYSAARLLLDAISACIDPRTVPPLSA